MAQSFNYDGGALTTVRREDVSLTEKADHGDVGSGTVVIDDDAGTIEIVGHKSFTARQTSCSDTRTFDGYVGERSYKRGNREMISAGREIEITTLDMNARLAFKAIRGRTGKRPSETISARLTWLLASSFLSTLVADNGFVTYPSTVLDKNDYRGQFPADVLRDMALVAGFNFFVYPDATTGDASLWFADSNSSTDYTSTLSISNVAADVDLSTVFPPFQDAELTRDPSQVISGVLMPFQKGSVYRTRAATEATFEPRDGVAPSSDVKTRSRARTLADRYLVARRNEEDLVTATVRLPASKVNLIRAGQRVACTFSHFATEGYGTSTYFRVLERTVSHPLNDDNTYDLRLRMSPQEVGCTPASVVQFKGTASVGSTTITLDSAVTVGNLLIAIGVRRSTDTPGMDPSEGFTELEQAFADDCCGNGGSTGTVFAAAKVATSTTATYSRLSDAGQYQWWLYEIAGGGIADISVLSIDHHDELGAATASINAGTFSNASGVAIMAASIGRSTDQAATAGAFSMGTWTEDFDDQLDPTIGAPIGSPWVGVGHTSASAADIACSWTYTESGTGSSSQGVGEWAAIAVLVNGGTC